MLKEILAITGKPGLFRIISHTGKTLIVEDIESAKRFPVSMRDRVVSLGDIAIYTEEDDKPLGEVLDLIYTAEKGGKIDVKELIKEGNLKNKFAGYLPDFDKEKVRDSDLKKLFGWYNLLVGCGFDKFAEEEEPKEEEPSTDKTE